MIPLHTTSNHAHVKSQESRGAKREVNCQSCNTCSPWEEQWNHRPVHINNIDRIPRTISTTKPRHRSCAHFEITTIRGSPEQTEDHIWERRVLAARLSSNNYHSTSTKSAHSESRIGLPGIVNLFKLCLRQIGAALCTQHSGYRLGTALAGLLKAYAISAMRQWPH